VAGGIDRQQAGLVVGVLLMLALVMAGAAFYGQQGARSGATGSAKRFTAKAGTTRENARFLRSKRAPTEEAGRDGSGDQERPGEWGDPDYDITSVTTGDPEGLEATPEEAAIRSVKAQIESGAALDQVLAALREQAGDLDEAEALRRLGEAYGQAEPPRTALAQEAFERALSVAVDNEQRAAILAAAAEQYLDAGDGDAARLRIEMGLAGLPGVPDVSGEAAVSPARLRLKVLLARSHEEAGAVAEAQDLYAQSIEEALSLPPETAATPSVADMLRLASTRLSWILHRQGQHEAASELGKRVRPTLLAAP